MSVHGAVQSEGYKPTTHETLSCNNTRAHAPYYLSDSIEIYPFHPTVYYIVHIF